MNSPAKITQMSRFHSEVTCEIFLDRQVTVDIFYFPSRKKADEALSDKPGRKYCITVFFFFPSRGRGINPLSDTF